MRTVLRSSRESMSGRLSEQHPESREEEEPVARARRERAASPLVDSPQGSRREEEVSDTADHVRAVECRQRRERRAERVRRRTDSCGEQRAPREHLADEESQRQELRVTEPPSRAFGTGAIERAPPALDAAPRAREQESGA